MPANIHDINLLAQELVNLYQREQDKAAVSLLLNWFRQLAEHGRVPPEDYAQLDYVYRSEEEVRTMLVAALEQERKNIYAKGEADGFVKGEAVGLAAGMEVQRQTILQLLQFRFNLAEMEQKPFATKLEQIQMLEQLQRLTNGLLNPASRLEDFTTQWQAILPRISRHSLGVCIPRRHTFDKTDGWGRNHAWGPPFVFTHYIPAGWLRPNSTVTFVTDGSESAVSQTKAAAVDLAKFICEVYH